MRRLARLVGLASLLGLSCNHPPLASCDADGGSSVERCSAGESCVWTRSDGRQGYFCARQCDDATPCPVGFACRPNASGCAVCADVISICN